MDDADAFFDAVARGDVTAVRAALDDEPHLLGAVSSTGVRPPLVALYAGHLALADELAGRSGELDVHEATAFDDTGRLRQLVAIDPGVVSAWSADGWQPLHLAATYGRTEAGRLLLDEDALADSQSRNDRAISPLYAAAETGHSEMVWLLIGSGADATAPVSGGSTPLHAAAQRGDADSVQALLSAGASAQVADDSGMTPIDLAIDAVRDLLT